MLKRANLNFIRECLLRRTVLKSVKNFIKNFSITTLVLSSSLQISSMGYILCEEMFDSRTGKTMDSRVSLFSGFLEFIGFRMSISVDN